MKKRVLKTQKPQMEEIEKNGHGRVPSEKVQEGIIDSIEKKILDKIHDEYWKSKMKDWEHKKDN